MNALSTEDGDDCSAALPPCDAEGRGARQTAKPFTSSLHAPLPLRKEVHCFCMAVASCVHEGCLTVTLCIPPSFSTSSPTASACPQMIYSRRLPVLHRCILGAEPQSGSLGLAARAGVSTEHWGLPSVRQRRVGQRLGLSISSPLAERVSGRTASVGPIYPRR